MKAPGNGLLLNLETPHSLEFQRADRLRKKRTGQLRPIIARFLTFLDRELVFRSVGDLGEESEVKVYADLPREIQLRRKRLWPEMKRARKEGTMAYFNKQDPE